MTIMAKNLSKSEILVLNVNNTLSDVRISDLEREYESYQVLYVPVYFADFDHVGHKPTHFKEVLSKLDFAKILWDSAHIFLALPPDWSCESALILTTLIHSRVGHFPCIVTNTSRYVHDLNLIRAEFRNWRFE
jgi:hypothetical protein